jgi:hypothetical protein
VIAIPLLLVLVRSSSAFPEFQAWIEITSDRAVDCAFCHACPDGPQGPKPGQMGSLSDEDAARLDKARAILEPGQVADNPILNVFGNSVASRIGMTELKELRKAPAFLPAWLGPDGDLDHDGIRDSQEIIDGTLPLDDQNGDPWRLFLVNLRRQAFPLVMTLLATVIGLRGLHLVLRWFGRSMGSEAEHGKPEERDR